MIHRNVPLVPLFNWHRFVIITEKRTDSMCNLGYKRPSDVYFDEARGNLGFLNIIT